MKFIVLLIASASAISISSVSPDPYKNVTANHNMGANGWISDEVIQAHKDLTRGYEKTVEDKRIGGIK